MGAAGLDVVGHLGLALAGLVAGCLNVVAGGGSLLTVPALLLLGLPADVANATNRLSIVTQSASGVVGFGRAGAIDRRALVPVIATAALGSLAGALGATLVPAAALEIVLLAVMVLMGGLLLVAPAAVVAANDGEPRWSERRGVALLALFGAGLYGGFVQAGVGFLLVGVLSGVLGYPVGRASALKAVATLVFGGVALAVFAASGLVAWLPAALLAIYSAIGATVGVRIALRVDPRVVRWLLFVGVLVTSIAALAR